MFNLWIFGKRRNEMSDAPVKEPEAAEGRREHRHEQCDQAEITAQGFSRKVKVVAKPGTSKRIDFELESDLKSPQTGQLVFNKDNDRMKKKDYYLIDFDLDDQTGLNLRFAPNPMKALWVNMGDAMNPPPCPATASYCDDVYAICVEPNGKKMTVRNDDAKIQYFTFSLGFFGDPDESEYRFDPGGTNEDGGSS